MTRTPPNDGVNGRSPDVLHIVTSQCNRLKRNRDVNVMKGVL